MRIVTIQRHLLDQQNLHPDATGELTRLLWDLTIAVKTIGSHVRRAGLIEILGETEEENVHGERVMKLDRFAQDTITNAMKRGGYLCVMGSEEDPDPIPIPVKYPCGDYVLLFDPLDGSSNIDVNVSVGTIFSIYKRVTRTGPGTLEDLLQKGSEQVAAGYVIYGSSTMLVYTTGEGVAGFTLDPSIGEFLLSHPKIEIPARGKIYSVNEGYEERWDEGTKAWVRHLKNPEGGPGHPYRARYIGSMVSDVHRTLLSGGIFCYPAIKTGDRWKPKLRLLYEAAPMAWLAEQAGGTATDGRRRLLDIVPESLHERTPVVLGSPEDVAEYERFYAGVGVEAGK